MYILVYLNTTDEAVEVKKKKKRIDSTVLLYYWCCHCFRCAHLAGIMHVMIVFIDLEV